FRSKDRWWQSDSMIVRSLAVSLPRLFWRSTSCLNLAVGFASSGGGGDFWGLVVLDLGLRLATSETQILEHRSQARVIEQALSGLGVAQDLGGLRVKGGALPGRWRRLLGLGHRPGLHGRRLPVRPGPRGCGLLRADCLGRGRL